jgi:PncC family amidohydrolase
MTAEPLEVTVGEWMLRRGLSLAIAESCTGGLVGHLITNVAGSSAYFLGGILAYANEIKLSLLNVRPETLEQFGAVSRETVLEMARGVRQACQADIGLAVSGIAGPTGATPTKPVGLVWIGLCVPGVETAQDYRFQGSRLAVKEGAAQAALRRLLEYLAANPPV